MRQSGLSCGGTLGQRKSVLSDKGLLSNCVACAFVLSLCAKEGVEKTNYTKRLSNMRACASQTHAVA